MDHLLAEVQARIPANKFYPPVLDPERNLLRTRLVQDMQRRPARIVSIEAQAGQGKTVLAAQYLEQAGLPFAWYQVGPEDGDPVLFLTALLACFAEALPGFRSPLLERMLENGQVSSLELSSLVNILLGDLDGHLDRDFCLVLDDLHLVENAEASQALLGHLLETAPPKLRFILAARRPLCLEPPAFKGPPPLVVTNEDLALTEVEISRLYNEVLRVPLTGRFLKKIHEATEGWMMGLILAAHAMENRRTPLDDHFWEKGRLLEYFNTEIFGRLPDELQRTLLRLSLLDEIPVALAEEFSEVQDIGACMVQLSRRNFFVRSLDDEGTVFRFHHLFREFLRERAARRFKPAESNRTLELAADWCRRRQWQDAALNYYLRAENFEALERCLEQDGIRLWLLSRLATLEAVLTCVPEEILRKHGWLGFYRGMVLMEKDPPSALPFFQQALKRFIALGDGLGQLFATAQIVYFDIRVRANFRDQLPLLKRLEDLFRHQYDGLDDFSVIRISQILSMALIFFQGEMRRSRRYSELALERAGKNRMVNDLAGIYMARIWGWFPHWEPCAKEIESSYPLTRSPQLGKINRLFLESCYVNFLVMAGDFQNYRDRRERLLKTIENDLLARSVSGPFLLIWDIDVAVAQGRFAQARELIQRGLELPHAGASPHLRSQFLHYQAFIEAIDGSAEEAAKAAEASLGLRAIAGGRVFVMLNRIVVGAALVQLRREGEAAGHLEEALADARRIGERFMEAAALAHLAWLGYRRGSPERAGRHLREWLAVMRANRYVHFFTWVPQVLQPLLETAVKSGIESDYARFLARERLGMAILPDGTSIPILQIRTLGGLSLSVEGGVALQSEGLTPRQRTLLASLIGAPGLKISQERIQTILWPESPPEKARPNFDNQLLRLRKLLGKIVAPHPVNHYLALKKGILCLENCWVDAPEFFAKAGEGLNHAGKKEFWQAGNAFYSACRLWQGEFLPSVGASEEVQRFREDLERMLIDASCAWAEILVWEDRVEDADRLVSRALHYDPISDQLVRIGYRLNLEGGRPSRALQLLKNYERVLKEEDYLPEEIDGILAEVAQTSS